MFKSAYAEPELLSVPVPRRSGRYRSRSTAKAQPSSPKIGVSRESHSASELPSEVHDEVPKSSDSAAVYYLQTQHEKCLQQLESAAKTCEDVGNRNATEVAENMTCAKIARVLQDHATKLRIWAFECGLDDLSERLDSLQRQAVDSSDSILRSLTENVARLESECLFPIQHKPEAALEADSDTEYAEDEEVSIGSRVKGIDIQLRSLSRLTMLLRAAANPKAFRQVEKLVEEVVKYFGSSEALKHYQINEDFKGWKALEEARANAEELGISDLDAVQTSSEEDNLPESNLGRFLSHARERRRGTSGAPKDSKTTSNAGKGRVPIEPEETPWPDLPTRVPFHPKGYLRATGSAESLSDIIGKTPSGWRRKHRAKVERVRYEQS